MNLFRKTLLSVPAADAAKALGIPIRTIYNWRTGLRVPATWVQNSVTANLRAYLAIRPKVVTLRKCTSTISGR